MKKSESLPSVPALRAASLIDRLGRLMRSGEHAGDLNPAQWEALRYLARANRFSRTPAALAQYLGSTRGTVSQTLIALEDHGRIVLGVVSAPALHRRWWAERGEGAHANGDVVRVSRIARPEDAVLTFALEQSLPRLAGRAWHARGYGDFWSHMLVAEGAVDGAIDAIGVSLWDLAAVQVIVEEAGGTFTDFAGEHRVDGGSAISSNGLLHAELLEAVAELTR